MDDCLFCKIIAGEIPCSKVWEDENTFAFRDINPVAPTHILLVPKAHIPSVDALTPENVDAATACLLAVPQIAAAEGLMPGGYRVVSNCGPDAGQTVQHLHFHILGGKPLDMG